MRVIVRCRVSLFERDGAFQVYVEDLFPDGLGAMQMAFEQLKARAGAQRGFLHPNTKSPCRAHPQRIGLVTSRTGAAIQDILNVTRRRCPGMEFVLCPVNVQARRPRRASCVPFRCWGHGMILMLSSWPAAAVPGKICGCSTTRPLRGCLCLPCAACVCHRA